MNPLRIIHILLLFIFPFFCSRSGEECSFLSQFSDRTSCWYCDKPRYYGISCTVSLFQRHQWGKAISVLHLSPLNMYDHLFDLTMRLRNKSWIEKVKRIARVIKIPKIKSDYWQNLKVCYDDCFLYTDLFCLLSSKFIPELKGYIRVIWSGLSPSVILILIPHRLL